MADAKDFLRQAYRIEQRIRAKHEQIQHMRELAERATSNTSAERTSGTPQHSKVETCVCAIIDLEADIKQSITELTTKRAQIQQTINTVPNTDYKLLLELRYLNFKSWDEIAEAMNYTYRWTLTLHGRALGVVKQIIENHIA